MICHINFVVLKTIEIILSTVEIATNTHTHTYTHKRKNIMTITTEWEGISLSNAGYFDNFRHGTEIINDVKQKSLGNVSMKKRKRI